MCGSAVRGMLMKDETLGVEKVEINIADGTATCTVAAGTKPEDLAKKVGGRFSATVKQ